MRAFFLIWFGQAMSLTGSGFTSFALGIWVYQLTNSSTQFALVSLFASLPGVLVLLVSGMVVDRYDRRRIMIFSNLCAAINTLILAFLYWTGHLEIWHVYVSVTIFSTCTAFLLPAFSSTVSLLVPIEHLGRAGGMVEAAQAMTQLIGPLLAGMLITKIGIHGVVLIDFATFLFAIFMLLIAKVLKHKIPDKSRAEGGSLLRETIYGLTYITSRHRLLSLMIFIALANFMTGIALVLVTPLVLSFASPAVLGRVLFLGGSGMLLGGLVMSLWGGPRRRIYGILAFTLLQGFALILAGLRSNSLLIAGAAFAFLFCYPIINGCNQAFWQSKTPHDLQGRIFAARRMMALSTAPLAYAVAGPLADYIFKPLLNVDGPLADSVGRIIGVGPERGIGLLIIFLGALLMIMAIKSYLNPHLRLLEDELQNIAADHPLKEG